MNGHLLNDIKDVLRNGGNVTHLLEVKVSRQYRSKEKTAIQREIFKVIANTPVTMIVDGVAVTIIWRTSASANTAYYHADVPFFTDIIVKRHTMQLLADSRLMLNPHFNNIIAADITSLAFVVSKPLSRTITLVDDDISDLVGREADLSTRKENNHD
jgi:hypothetical protein